MSAATISIGSRLPFKNLSVIIGKINIAHACPSGKTIELNIPFLIERPSSSIKYVGTQVKSPYLPTPAIAEIKQKTKTFGSEKRYFIRIQISSFFNLLF